MTGIQIFPHPLEEEPRIPLAGDQASVSEGCHMEEGVKWLEKRATERARPACVCVWSVVLERAEMELNQPWRDIEPFLPYRPAHRLHQCPNVILKCQEGTRSSGG